MSNCNAQGCACAAGGVCHAQHVRKGALLSLTSPSIATPRHRTYSLSEGIRAVSAFCCDLCWQRCHF